MVLSTLAGVLACLLSWAVGFVDPMRYKAEGPAPHPGGQGIRIGSSRDWAAKGVALLGVRAVIAESFERIHRSNLVGMGVLPLQFQPGVTAASLGLTGKEVFEVTGIAQGLGAGGSVSVRAVGEGPKPIEFQTVVRIDTPEELVAYRHGGILPGTVRVRARRTQQRVVIRVPASGLAKGAGRPGASRQRAGDLERADSRRDQIQGARLGFDACGIAPAADLPELPFFRDWLDRGYAGDMSYLARSAARQPDVRQVLPSARTVIVTATELQRRLAVFDRIARSCRAHIARYAWGDDYHDVILERMESLLAWMRQESDEPFDARPYVDTGPVQERVYARHAGIGWIGKNTCVISHTSDRGRCWRDHLQPAARRRRARL